MFGEGRSHLDVRFAERKTKLFVRAWVVDHIVVVAPTNRKNPCRKHTCHQSHH